MKKAFIVVEDYTCAFCGMFSTFEKAWERACEIGGSVIEYIFDGEEWHNMDGED